MGTADTTNSSHMRVLGIIPARGGSKGIPRKNLYDINGMPLIAYTILPAKKAVDLGVIDKLIVSTDDTEIAAVSERYGAEVPFLRPADISGDKAKSVDLMIHAYEYFESQGDPYDVMMLLQPTSPLRSLEDIIGVTELFKTGESDSLISCYKEERIHELGLYHKQDNLAIGLNPKHNEGIRRQDIPNLYVRNGAFFVAMSQYIVREKKDISSQPLMYLMPKERSIDINDLDDIASVKRWLDQHHTF